MAKQPGPSARRAAGKSSGKAAKSATSNKARRAAVLVFALSGMAALIYEVAWTRELSLVFGSTVYAVSMMLTAFMSGLSLGAFLGGKWADKSKDLLGLFAGLEFGIAVFGLLSIPLTQALPSIYLVVYDSIRPGFGLFFFIQLLLSFLIMLVPTTFMGATFPVVSKINTASVDEIGVDVGNVYSINTLGSIAGSTAAGFLLIPLIGVKATVFVAAALNLVVSVAMLALSKRGITRRWLPGTLAVLFVVGAWGVTTDQAAYAASFYRIGDFATLEDYQAYREQIETRFFKDGVHGRIAVFEDAQGELHLQNSGKIEGSTQLLDRQTTSLLAALPIMSAQEPENVLIVGLGTGFTTLESLRYDVDRVDTVEISGAVVDASAFFVGDQLEGDPRSTTYQDDARNFLLKTETEYDVVSSEPSYPLSTHVSHLFTLEFYELVQDHLTEDGVFCQWIPRYLLTDDDMLMMMKTFTQAFPNTYVWGSNHGGDEAVDLMLIGINGDRVLDPAAIQREVVEADQWGMDFGFFGGPGEVMAAVADPDIPINTDDRPLLEFRTPRNQIEFYRQGREGLTGQ